MCLSICVNVWGREREREGEKGEKTQFQVCVLKFGMASKFKFMGTSQDVFTAHIFITRSLILNLICHLKLIIYMTFFLTYPLRLFTLQSLCYSSEFV